MMMTFHEFNFGMVVMDEKRCVAKAKQTISGWMLSLHGASWAHKTKVKNRLGIISPSLMVVDSRTQARKILQELAKGPF